MMNALDLNRTESPRPLDEDRPPKSGVARVAPKEDSVMLMRTDESGLREVIGQIQSQHTTVRAWVKASKTARPEPVTDVPGLFWKLLEKRVHGAELSFTQDGLQVRVLIHADPDGFAIERSTTKA